MKHFLKILIVILLVVTSCKTNKNITDTNAITNISTKRIINNHYTNNFNQKTVNAKIVGIY